MVSCVDSDVSWGASPRRRSERHTVTWWSTNMRSRRRRSASEAGAGPSPVPSLSFIRASTHVSIQLCGSGCGSIKETHVAIEIAQMHGSVVRVAAGFGKPEPVELFVIEGVPMSHASCVPGIFAAIRACLDGNVRSSSALEGSNPCRSRARGALAGSMHGQRGLGRARLRW